MGGKNRTPSVGRLIEGGDRVGLAHGVLATQQRLGLAPDGQGQIVGLEQVGVDGLHGNVVRFHQFLTKG